VADRGDRPVDIAPAKHAARAALDQARDGVVSLSRRIHSHPELGWAELQASTWLAEELTEAGYDVQLGAYGFATAFTARKGSGPLRIAICAEYDALPGIGHACGHNLISASSIAVARALGALVDGLDMTLTVIGTPAEEVTDRPGKALLLEQGAFDGQHAALMLHPCPYEAVTPVLIAATAFDVVYTGRAAHAAAAPFKGINALDALTVAQVAVGLLRQQLPPSHLVHTVVTEGGGAVNIIPARTRARFMVRAPSATELADLRARIIRCAEAGAHATGCSLQIIGGEYGYEEMQHDPRLAASYAANAAAVGRPFEDVPPDLARFTPSTDMGNVSSVVPSLHPYFAVPSRGAVNHQPEFAACCATAEAEDAMLGASLALAWTCLDLATDPQLRRSLLTP